MSTRPCHTPWADVYCPATARAVTRADDFSDFFCACSPAAGPCCKCIVRHLSYIPKQAIGPGDRVWAAKYMIIDHWRGIGCRRPLIKAANSMHMISVCSLLDFAAKPQAGNVKQLRVQNSNEPPFHSANH